MFLLMKLEETDSGGSCLQAIIARGEAQNWANRQTKPRPDRDSIEGLPCLMTGPGKPSALFFKPKVAGFRGKVA